MIGSQQPPGRMVFAQEVKGCVVERHDEKLCLKSIFPQKTLCPGMDPPKPESKLTYRGKVSRQGPAGTHFSIFPASDLQDLPLLLFRGFTPGPVDKGHHSPGPASRVSFMQIRNMGKNMPPPKGQGLQPRTKSVSWQKPCQIEFLNKLQKRKLFPLNEMQPQFRPSRAEIWRYVAPARNCGIAGGLLNSE